MTKDQLWNRFQRCYREYPDLQLALDLSRLNLPDDYFDTLAPRMLKAFQEMAALENGAIANPSEHRMVGHYWLRNPALAPTAEIRSAIETSVEQVKTFAAQVHQGEIRGAGGPFKNVLLIGIGGSALGPQFVSQALGHPARDRVQLYFFDNTDPDGMDRVLARIGPQLSQTLCIVTSKSGGTKETRNGMIEAEAAYRKLGLDFTRHAVAITMEDSKLDNVAAGLGWIRRFPMWDWVGGRTSELSVVGLLPAALQGLNIEEILRGARMADIVTREDNVNGNPSALLSASWNYLCNDKGIHDMVVVPYKDRLELFSRYLQQLIMESLGKACDRDGNIVNQGIVVYGNKGSTDQHAYVQQLRDGLHNFFVTFVEVLRDRSADSMEVEPQITAGDYLNGFLLGTREALFENGRESITITLREISEFTVGVLIAIFERAVGLYAALVNINPYDQPGVEAGKKAATEVLNKQLKILELFKERSGQPLALDEIATLTGLGDDIEIIFKVCEHLAANPDRGIQRHLGDSPFEARYSMM